MSKKTLGIIGVAALGLALFPTAALATGVPHIQDYIDGPCLHERTSAFVADNSGNPNPVTYKITDGTPPYIVEVPAHAVIHSPKFSIPASGASYTITAGEQTWHFTAAPDSSCETTPEPTGEPSAPTTDSPEPSPTTTAPTPGSETPSTGSETPKTDAPSHAPTAPSSAPVAPTTAPTTDSPEPSAQKTAPGSKRIAQAPAEVAIPVAGTAHFTG